MPKMRKLVKELGYFLEQLSCDEAQMARDKHVRQTGYVRIADRREQYYERLKALVE